MNAASTPYVLARVVPEGRAFALTAAGRPPTTSLTGHAIEAGFGATSVAGLRRRVGHRRPEGEAMRPRGLFGERGDGEETRLKLPGSRRSLLGGGARH